MGHAEGSGNVYFGLSLVRTLHFQILNCYKLKIHRINTSLKIEKVLTVFSIFEKIFSKINSLMVHINRTLFLRCHIQRSFVMFDGLTGLASRTWPLFFFFLFVCVNTDQVWFHCLSAQGKAHIYNKIGKNKLATGTWGIIEISSSFFFFPIFFFSPSLNKGHLTIKQKGGNFPYRPHSILDKCFFFFQTLPLFLFLFSFFFF